jgi:hypothetical protein
MRITVTQAEGEELADALNKEGITYEIRDVGAIRELDTGSWQLFSFVANLPEVKVPPGLSGGDIGARAFQLPSGRLIIINGDGELEKITIPPPHR